MRIRDLAVSACNKCLRIPPAMLLAGQAAIALACFWLTLAALSEPIGFLSALLVGVSTRSLEQGIRLRRLRVSQSPARIAAFEYDGSGIRCSFDEKALSRFVDSRTGRLSAGVLSGLVCWGFLHWSLAKASFLPLPLFRIHGFAGLNALGQEALPLVLLFLFLRFPGPRKLWARQIVKAIETRTAAALEGTQEPLELDGLELGAAILWSQLGLVCTGGYREAVRRRLRANPAQAVLHPASTRAMLAAVTELARLDMAQLGAATASFRRLDVCFAEHRALLCAVQDHSMHLRQKAFQQQSERLKELFRARRWKAAQEMTCQLQADLDEFCEELQSRARLLAKSAPRVTLSSAADPLHLLGADANASLPAIKRLRQRLAQVYHPDVGGETCNAAKMAELNAAYDAVLLARSGRMP
jgi:hypothetical protein